MTCLLRIFSRQNTATFTNRLVFFYNFMIPKTFTANLKEMRTAKNQETIEVVGKRLRKACGLQKND